MGCGSRESQRENNRVVSVHAVDFVSEVQRLDGRGNLAFSFGCIISVWHTHILWGKSSIYSANKPPCLRSVTTWKNWKYLGPMCVLSRKKIATWIFWSRSRKIPAC